MKIEEFCSCGFTASQLLASAEFLQCLSEPDEITYRARLSGTASYTSAGIVADIEEWVSSGEATIVVQALRLSLDSSCQPVGIDSFEDPECEADLPVPVQTPGPATEVPVTEIPIANATGTGPLDSGSDSSAGVTLIGGIAMVVVVLIVAITVAVIVIIVLVLLTRRRRSNHLDHELAQ